MNALERIEKAIRNFERILGETVTIIDNDGIFNSKQKCRIFSPERASHRKNRICACVFSDSCASFCRYRINALCREKTGAFKAVCPKGIEQIVIPLRYRMVNYGIFYLGIRRMHGYPPDWKELSPVFRKEYSFLKEFSAEEEERLSLLGEVFADGIIHGLFRDGILCDSPDFRNARIRDFLKKHLSEKIGLGDLAEELELSPSHTSALVRKLFGVPFSVYLQKLRVNASLHLLAKGNLTLEKIARECGFSSAFHYSKVFRTHMLLPPGRYFKEQLRSGK